MRRGAAAAVARAAIRGTQSGRTSSIATACPDAGRWDYEVGLIRNNERQYYTRDRPENARVENGLLVIEARREAFQGADYTSASLTSRASWTYGRIEVRAKLPKGRGTWPAIWMLGTNIRQVGWPECGEIDIMEHVGFDPGRIHANIHTRAYNHVQGTNKGNSVVVLAPDGEFHVLLRRCGPSADRRLRRRSAVLHIRQGTGRRRGVAVRQAAVPHPQSCDRRKLGRPARHRRRRVPDALRDRLRQDLSRLNHTRMSKGGGPPARG